MDAKDEFTAQKLGIKLLKIRESKGMNQTQLAKICGVQVSRLSEYENGKFFPRVLILRKICLGCGVSMDDLLDIPR